MQKDLSKKDVYLFVDSIFRYPSLPLSGNTFPAPASKKYMSGPFFLLSAFFAEIGYKMMKDSEVLSCGTVYYAVQSGPKV